MLGMSQVWQPGRRYQLHGNCRQARLAPLAWCVPGLAPGQPLPAMRQMRACKALYSTSFYASLCGSGHVIFFSASLLPLF